MAVVAVGLDRPRMDRLEAAHARRGERWLLRLFTAGEKANREAREERRPSYAGRFALEEAVMKVLGTNWARGSASIHVAITHDGGIAAAVAVAEGGAP